MLQTKNLIRIIPLFLVIFCFSSCSTKKESQPKETESPPKEEVLLNIGIQIEGGNYVRGELFGDEEKGVYIIRVTEGSLKNIHTLEFESKCFPTGVNVDGFNLAVTSVRCSMR